MATQEQAKFLYFKTSSAYNTAKSKMAVGAIAFDAQGQHIYVKAAASGADHEYYIGDIINDCSTDSSVKSLSAAQGKLLRELIASADSSITSIKSDIADLKTKDTEHDSSLKALDASSADYATRIGAIEVLDTKMQQAIIAVAKACAANQLEAEDKSVVVTEGSVDASKMDGSIMDGVTKAKIKVNVWENKGLAVNSTNGLYVDGTKLTDIPISGVSDLQDKLYDLSTAIENEASARAAADASEAAERKFDVSTLEAADTSLKSYVDNSLNLKVNVKDSSNFTWADKTKLDGIAEGAQVNVIEKVQVNGTDLSINNKTVNVVIPAATVTGVKAGDKVLKLDPSTTLLETAISMEYSSANKKIYLKGLDGSVISTVDAEAFIKDGMLTGHAIATATATSQEITFSSGRKHTFTDLVVGKTYLFFEFSNGASTPTYTYEKLDVTQLVDVYTVHPDSVNYLDISAYKIGAKVEVANGLAGFEHLKKTDASLADVSSRFATFKSNTEDAISTINTKNSDQDSSITDISTKVVTLNGDATVAGSVKKQIADASAGLIGKNTDASNADTIYGAKKWATEAAAKAADDVSVNLTATGDNLVSISPSNSKSGNVTTLNANIAATGALKDAVANANNALQSIKVNGTALTKDSSAVDISVRTGSSNGTIAVQGTDIAVKGLQSAAYVTKDSLESTMDTKDASVVVNVKADLIGANTDASSASTIWGAKNYAKEYTDAATAWYVES